VTVVTLVNERGEAIGTALRDKGNTVAWVGGQLMPPGLTLAQVPQVAKDRLAVLPKRPPRRKP
jgi:hypothetical protein